MNVAIPFTVEAATSSCDNSTNPKGTCSAIDDIESRLRQGHERMDFIEAEGRERTTRIERKLDANCADTAEVLDILRLGKSFFRVAGYFGAFLKWFTAIAAPVLVFWYTIKGGK